MVYKPIAPRRRSFRSLRLPPIGGPKYEVGDTIGYFEVIRYEGHSEVNKRTALTMSKAQHWYRCRCTCGHEEYRSQQELVDPRRQQKCERCRHPDEDDVQQLELRCNRCNRPMLGTTSYDGTCSCSGLIEINSKE